MTATPNQGARKLALGLISFAVLGALGWAGFLAIATFIAWFDGLEKEVATSIVAASGTVFAAVATVVYSQNRSQRRQVAEAHRPKKIEIYSSFMEVMVAQLQSVKGKTKAPCDLVETIMAFKRDIIMWASPEVIGAYRKVEDAADDGTVAAGDSATILSKFDDLLRAMRKDLGNSNRNLGRGQLWALFLDADARKQLGL